jgi:sec-independent protein translocase protein TatA
MSAPMLAVLDEWHVIVLGLIIVLLFGGKKLPELARGLGEAMREFKKASRDLHDEPPPAAVKPAPPAPAQPAAAPQQPSEPKQG